MTPLQEEQLALNTDQAHIIPAHLAITAMRDSGYKNTAYALAELIDNSQQAGASIIEVLCTEKRELVRERERCRLSKIAVLDNGSGMDAPTLQKALQFGNGTRLGDRSGIGRFGMGLPNASISQAGMLEVWSWKNGTQNALYTYLNVGNIENGSLHSVPYPKHNIVPQEWLELSENIGTSGTLVVWSELDIHRLTWKRAKPTLQNTERIVGRIYRRFITNQSITIRLFAQEENGEVVFNKHAQFDDPLFLQPSPVVPAPFDKKAMFDFAFDEPVPIEYEGAKHIVNVKYSVASSDTVTEAGTQDRGQTLYGKHAAKNIGVSVIRADRELMIDQGWCIGYDPRERWWGAEVEFPPTLDELFGVTNNKQAATHFSELATIDWKHLAEEGEGFIDVVTRLKEDGDPRGWLLPLSDSIQRNLTELRNIIKSQGKGARSTHPERHDTPDDLTKTVNVGWKDRSKERPIAGEDITPSTDDLETIKSDLTDNKQYTEVEAVALVELIKAADLKVVFLEADFPDAYQLFNVQLMGGLTQVVFNRKHPAFDNIFNTINTVDEDIHGLSKEELLDRLSRSVNGTKIIFAAWARYEREAGIDKAKALQKVRFDWGQIAAEFLCPENDTLL